MSSRWRWSAPRPGPAWIAAIILGPLGAISGRPAPGEVARLSLAQNVALLWPMTGALNLLPALIVMLVSSLITDPGS